MIVHAYFCFGFCDVHVFPVCINCCLVNVHSMLSIVDDVCIFRVPGNSAAVTALQEELNNRGIENVCLQDEVWVHLCSLTSHRV